MYFPPNAPFDVERKATQRFSNAIAFFIFFPLLYLVYRATMGPWYGAYFGQNQIWITGRFALNIFLPAIIILWFFAQKANITSNRLKKMVPETELDAIPFAIGNRILLCLATATITAIFTAQAIPILITQINGTPGKWSGIVTGKKISRAGHGYAYHLYMSTTSKGIDIRDLAVKQKLWETTSVGDAVNIDGRLSRYGIIQHSLTVSISKPMVLNGATATLARR